MFTAVRWFLEREPVVTCFCLCSISCLGAGHHEEKFLCPQTIDSGRPAPTYWALSPGRWASQVAICQTWNLKPHQTRYLSEATWQAHLDTVLFIFFKIFIYCYLFIWLHQVLVAAHGIFSLHCGMGALSCSMWGLVL